MRGSASIISGVIFLCSWKTSVVSPVTFDSVYYVCEGKGLAFLLRAASSGAFFVFLQSYRGRQVLCWPVQVGTKRGNGFK